MHGRVPILDPTVVAATEQRAVLVKEGGTDRDAALLHAVAGLLQSDVEHLAEQRFAEPLSRRHMLQADSCPRPPDRTYTTTVGSQKVELPLVALYDELTIALLICVDMGVEFAETAGRELAEVMRPVEPEIIVSVATMGIPLAIEASRAMGLDDYVILHKTPKIHLGETWSEPVHSITTDKPQTSAHGPGPRRRGAGAAGRRGRRRRSPPAPRWPRRYASSVAWTPSRWSSAA